jgi:hypothetical protein
MKANEVIKNLVADLAKGAQDFKDAEKARATRNPGPRRHCLQGRY